MSERASLWFTFVVIALALVFMHGCTLFPKGAWRPGGYHEDGATKGRTAPPVPPEKDPE